MTDETTIAAEAARDAQQVRERRRRGWGCFACAVTALLLPVLVCMIVVVVDRHAAAEAQQRARDAGDPLTVQEMRALYGSTPNSERATAEWIAVLDAIVRDWKDASSNVPIVDTSAPGPTLDERGLYDAATLARAEPFLEKQARETLERAHAARNSAVEVRLPIPFEDSARTHHVFVLRGLCNALALEAEVHAARGELTEATDSLLTIVAASETLAEAPEPTAYLVRCSLFYMATDHAMRLIDRADFPPDDLERLQEAFARQRFHRPMLRAAQGNQFLAVQLYEGEGPLPRYQSHVPRWLPLRGGDQAMMLNLHREFLDGAATGFPEAERAAANVKTRVEALEDAGIVDEATYAITFVSGYAHNLGNLCSAALRAEAEARLCVACCACERYRQERNEWPPAMESIVPEYLPEVPLDPLDGQPLRYEVDGERMIIRSLLQSPPANRPITHMVHDGFASCVLGEPYEPEPAEEAAVDASE